MPKIEGPSPRLDRWCVAAIAAGVLVRAGLVLTGRITLDGDEAVMGIMANHVGHLERLPLYFYGQHYLGTVELPPLVFLQWLGPEGWKFSVWPIRIIEMLYFVGLCCIHFKLVSRFFGVHVGRWSLFFLCVAPVFWVVYSARLRHVTFMMMIGEAMTLVALDLIAAWNTERKTSGGRLLLLGFLGGIAWWHYQLVIIYLAGVTVLFVGFSSFAVDWIRRPSTGASG
ncbi:hypothetical protein IIC65_08850, partial [Candidatus Sumerlaeota bacterium]|nr:hypothetical protein [Candidatus Sumerlaeota bacterium]